MPNHPLSRLEQLKSEAAKEWDSRRETFLRFYEGAPRDTQLRLAHEQGFVAGALTQSETAFGRPNPNDPNYTGAAPHMQSGEIMRAPDSAPALTERGFRLGAPEPLQTGEVHVAEARRKTEQTDDSRERPAPISSRDDKHREALTLARIVVGFHEPNAEYEPEVVRKIAQALIDSTITHSANGSSGEWDRLMDLLENIVDADDANSGAEPSVSVLDRAIEEARRYVRRADAV
jgi:hypothetical protein